MEEAIHHDGFVSKTTSLATVEWSSDPTSHINSRFKIQTGAHLILCPHFWRGVLLDDML